MILRTREILRGKASTRFSVNFCVGISFQDLPRRVNKFFARSRGPESFRLDHLISGPVKFSEGVPPRRGLEGSEQGNDSSCAFESRVIESMDLPVIKLR